MPREESQMGKKKSRIISVHSLDYAGTYSVQVIDGLMEDGRKEK
jgi:hypothetical protein